MNLNELIVLESTNGLSNYNMPLSVQEGSVSNTVNNLGVNIESVFALVPLTVNNRVDILQNTKGLEMITLVDLNYVKHKFAFGIYEHEPNEYMFATTCLKDYKEDEYSNLTVPPLVEVCSMYESLHFGSYKDAIKNLERFYDLELLDGKTYSIVHFKLGAFAKKFNLDRTRHHIEIQYEEAYNL